MDLCIKHLDMDKKRWLYIRNSRNHHESDQVLLEDRIYSSPSEKYTKTNSIGEQNQTMQYIKTSIDIDIPENVLAIKSFEIFVPELLEYETVQISLRIMTTWDIIDEDKFYND